MDKNSALHFPQIEQLLQAPETAVWIEELGRPLVADIARTTVDSLRQSILAGGKEGVAFSKILTLIQNACRREAMGKIQNVINATGVILHTNMGRSPIPRDVWRAAEDINCGYSNLELDLQNGKRGQRKGLIPLLMSKLVGAEDALIVNNNAAAVHLILRSFAEGREVIVSRGEQVQIGGGFRIPEILTQSGAGLVEVGTTNITTVQDFKAAFSDETSMILSVHRSNFAIRGFTSSPGTAELAAIKPEGVLLCIDQGSGVIDEDLPGETTVRSHLRHGADLVSFSGDKVFGGPQAGIIVGRKELIARLEKHPLMRVFRPGKTMYSLLELHLLRRLNGVPGLVPESLAVEMQTLRNRGRRLLRGIGRDKASLVDSEFAVGGGALPDQNFPSLSVRINSGGSAEKILELLRNARPPVIGTIADDKVLLNLATIRDAEVPRLRDILRELPGD